MCEDLDHRRRSGEDEGRQGPGHPQGMMKEAEVERQDVAGHRASGFPHGQKTKQTPSPGSVLIS